MKESRSMYVVALILLIFLVTILVHQLIGLLTTNHLLDKAIHTLKEETFAEETFAISRFLAKFAKVCSREIFVNYKSRKFILAEKKKF